MKEAVMVGNEIVVELPATGHDPHDFSDIPLPDDLGAGAGEFAWTRAATLEEMLGEAKDIGALLPGYFYVSPKIRTLKRIFGVLKGMEQGAEEDAIKGLDESVGIFRELTRVNAGGKLVCPSIEQVEEQFTPKDLTAMIFKLIATDGIINEDAEPGNA